MPVTNWPPAGAPAWPDMGMWSNALDMVLDLRSQGWTKRTPTTAERNSFFVPARCDEGHQVVGIMLVSPGGTSYPFAICNNASHRQLLVLWGGDYCVGGMVERNNRALTE